MSKFIVFEWTGEILGPRKGEHYETPGGDILMCVEPDRAIGWYRIFRRLPDAEVEALEARLAEAADHVHDLKLMEADRDAWKERAEKAEAERDELRAKVDEHDSRQTGIRIALDAICPDMDGQRVIDPIERITRLGAEVARLRRMFDTSGTPGSLADARAKDLEAEIRRLNVSLEVAGIGYRDMTAENERLKARLDGQYNADTRARFERETAADLMRRIVNVDVRKDGSYGFEYARASKCVADARDLADEVFGPAPAAVKADAPLPPAANPFMVYGPGACNPAPVPAPPQFKIGDPVAPLTAEELEICRLPSRLAGIGATFYEENEGRAFIGFDGDSAWWIDKHYIRQAPPAPPQFKVGDPVVNSKGRRGKVAALYPNEMLDLCVRWDGDPHSCYEMSRELRPAPPEPWTPKVSDEVKIIASTYCPCDATRALIGSTGFVSRCGVSFESKPVAEVRGWLFHASDLELVRGAEDAAS